MIEPQDGAQRLRELWDRFTSALVRPPGCERCSSLHVNWDGWSIRSASVLDGNKTCHVTGIRLRRAECAACGLRWIVRPPGIAPNRHYQLCVVASAIGAYLFDPGATQAQVADTHSCSERTLGRWLRWMAKVADPAVLQARIQTIAEAPVLVPFKAVANLARKARQAARRELLPRAAEVLAHFEALGLVMGLEPPGLRGVIEAVVGGRSGIATYAHPAIPEFVKVTS